VFLYDRVPGGVGLAERLFEVREMLLGACLEAARVCPCEDGCPSCVGPQVERESPAKASAVAMLKRLLG
jgi:DEAD/DEAH box helicase domain-containing protein